MKLPTAILALCWLALAADPAQDLLDSARKGDVAGVKAALGTQADVEAKSRYGQTPLFLAAMNGHVEVVQLLLEKGARVDVTDTFYKSTAIAFAASRKHAAVVKVLLPRSTDFDRNLDTATGLRNPELVAAVLAAGKPSQAALDRNFELVATANTEIAELLRKAGAQPPAPGTQVDAKILESYAGTYKAEGFPLDIKVSAKEGKLHAQATGQPEFALKAKSEKLFEFAPARIEMEFAAPGSFILRQGGQVITFKKTGAAQ